MERDWSGYFLIFLDRKWNREFQEILELSDEKIKYEKLSELSRDFVYCAKTYGKVIISEKELHDDYKTIKPADPGGVAGGEKVRAIRFVFVFILFSHYLFVVYRGWDSF